MAGMNAISPLAENIAPPGLKGLIVADTEVGSVRGDEGWYHYRGYVVVVDSRPTLDLEHDERRAAVMRAIGITPTFTTSRVVGWGAHLLEQAANNKIMRPSARYTGLLHNGGYRRLHN